ncbi:uncharacterized protein LOC111897704 [Lactuca sativa]|uniref:uncharacterized protein LOC111897704 n=1 Tax=Lactuca sativa TaxID=4236 RepID=UPI000CD8F780|nr:uncharacterized protein LOC111897704 [Lactuca sativa]
MTGSNNDLNVLGASSIVNDMLQGKAPNMSFVVNEHQYNYGYYLGDGIYPEYAMFVKSYSFTADEKRKLFKLAQELARKDVERAFGVLKQKWHIIKHLARSWDKAKLTKVLTACVILHNMIIEEEGEAICMYNPKDIINPLAVIQVGSPTYFTRLLEIQNSETHHNLRYDLTGHIWQRQFHQHSGNDDDEVDDDDDDEETTIM